MTRALAMPRNVQLYGNTKLPLDHLYIVTSALNSVLSAGNIKKSSRDIVALMGIGLDGGRKVKQKCSAVTRDMKERR